MERWRHGNMETWRGRDRDVEGWRCGEVESWRDGETGRWRDGEMLQAPMCLCILYFLPRLLLSTFLHSSGKMFLQSFISWWEEQPVLVPSTTGWSGTGVGHWDRVRQELWGVMSIPPVLPSPRPGQPPPVLGPDRVQGPWARLSPSTAPGPHEPPYAVTRAPKVPANT